MTETTGLTLDGLVIDERVPNVARNFNPHWKDFVNYVLALASGFIFSVAPLEVNAQNPEVETRTECRYNMNSDKKWFQITVRKELSNGKIKKTYDWDNPISLDNQPPDYFIVNNRCFIEPPSKRTPTGY